MYDNVYSVLSERLWIFFYSDGIQTHDLLLTSADILTPQPLNLPYIAAVLFYFDYLKVLQKLSFTVKCVNSKFTCILYSLFPIKVPRPQSP